MLPQTKLIERNHGVTGLPQPPQSGLKFFRQSVPLAQAQTEVEAGADHPWAMVESPMMSESDDSLQREVTTTVTQILSNLSITSLESLIVQKQIFVLNLTSGTAMNCPLAKLYTDAVLQRFKGDRVPRDEAERIELCLAEVIANAIIHGNLGLTPLWQLMPQAIDKNQELRRLTLIALIHRPIQSSQRFEIIVSDAGQKFSDRFIPDLPCLDQLDQNQMPRGRGLAIVRELGVELGCILGNNSVRLSFPWKN
ncbi:MAG: ATP-binding protein [Candidatus Pacebacteria bacterium]|nr:ATP-binding protein [Candidatus Paceibacterota bacterium]